MYLDLLAVNHAVFPIASEDGLNLGDLYDALEERINALPMAQHDPIMLRACTRTYDQILEITRIGVGGDYENALYLVGGEPPTSGPMVKTVC